MNLLPSLFVAAFILTLAGCAEAPASSQHEPYVKPGLVVLTADQAAARGINVHAPAPQADPAGRSERTALEAGGFDPLASDAVIATPDVKVYTLSREVDPADPTLLHEEHVVYRRETTPRWKLDAPAAQKLLIGPRVTDGRQELRPVLDKELTSFLADQRRATEANQKAVAALFQAVDSLTRQQQELARRELAKNGDHPEAVAREGDARPAASRPENGER